ncbi:hypothetical protein LLH23_18065 [bacterium]|nr:hypothetical protein [bacterium]
MNQGCLKAFAIVLLLLGVLLGFLGLVFAIAPGRAGTGLVMLVLGIAIIGFAATRLKAMQALSPEGVEQQITRVAADSNGDLTVGALAGQTGLPDSAVRDGLQRLLDKGLAKIELRDGVEHYVFAGLKQEKMIKKCPYCGNEYPVSQAGRTCPSCGGNLEVRPQ